MAELPTLMGCAIAALLLVAAWHDLATRLIPDSLPALIALFGLGARLPLGLAEVAASVAVAVLLFALLVPLVLRGALGGGDAKLVAALALGFAPLQTWDFLFVTTMVGGLLALGYLAGPLLVGRPPALRAQTPLLRRVLIVEHRRLRRRGPLPYAIAIACGGIVMHLVSPGG